MRKKTFTLIELMTVLVVIGIGMVMFYSTFFINWASFDNQIARTNLWQEINEIMNIISFDGKYAKAMDVSEDGSSVTFTFPDNSQAVYSITPQGTLEVTKAGITNVLSQNIYVANSSFAEDTNSLVVNLALQQKEVFGQIVAAKTSTKIYPRNLNSL